MTEQTYLGDGVYANFDGYHVVLTTGPSNNPIFLDQAVWQALVDYGKRAFGSPVKETLYGNCPVCHEGEPPYGA